MFGQHAPKWWLVVLERLIIIIIIIMRELILAPLKIFLAPTINTKDHNTLLLLSAHTPPYVSFFLPSFFFHYLPSFLLFLSFLPFRGIFFPSSNNTTESWFYCVTDSPTIPLCYNLSNTMKSWICFVNTIESWLRCVR